MDIKAYRGWRESWGEDVYVFVKNDSEVVVVTTLFQKLWQNPNCKLNDMTFVSMEVWHPDLREQLKSYELVWERDWF